MSARDPARVEQEQQQTVNPSVSRQRAARQRQRQELQRRRRRRARQQQRQEFAGEFDQFEPEDVVYEDGRFAIAESALRREARESALEQAGEGFTEEDVEITRTDEGFQAQIGEGARRRELREDILAAAGEGFTGEDVVFDESGQGIEARISEAAQRRELREDILEQAGDDYTAEDVEFVDTEQGLQARIAPEAQRRVVRQRAASQAEDLAPSDIAVEQTDEGFQAQLTEEAADRFASEQIERLEESGFGTPVPEAAQSVVRELQFIQSGPDRANLGEALDASGASVGIGALRDNPAAIIRGLDPEVVERYGSNLPVRADEVREAQEAIRQAEQLRDEDPSEYVERFATEEALEEVARIEADVAQSFERGRAVSRAQRQYREAVGEELGVPADRIIAERTGDGFEVTGFFGEAEEELQQRIAEEEFGGDVSPDEIRLGVESGEIQARLTEEGGEQVIESRLEADLGRDVNLGEDFRVVQEEGQFVAQPIERPAAQRVVSEEARSIGDIGAATGRGREAFAQAYQAREELESQLQTAAAEREFSEVGVAGVPGQQARITAAGEVGEQVAADIEASLERRVALQRAAARGGGAFAGGVTADSVDLEAGEDYTIRVTDEGVGAGLTPAFEESLNRELIAADVERQAAEAGRAISVDPQEDIRLTDEGAVLSESAREELRGEEPSDGFRIYAQRDVSGDPTAEDMGPLGVLDLRTREERELESVRALEELDPLTDTYSEITGRAGDFAALIPGGQQEQVVIQQALGEELSERGLESASVTDVSPSEFLDITLETSERVQERSPAARFRAGVGTGVASIPTIPLTLPSTAVRGTEFAGTGAQEIAAGRGEEFAGEVGRAAEQAVVDAVDYAQENPYRTGGLAVGSLAASAVTMGGAAAVSTRAGLASRVAIQPGEELLGYGGSAAFSRTASGLSRASRALPDDAVGRGTGRLASGFERGGEVLFPRNEPLFFSEEAAIMGARRLSRGVRSRYRGARDIATGERLLADVAPTRSVRTATRFRPGGPTELAGGEAEFVAGPSEPLGGAGRGSVLEAEMVDQMARANQPSRTPSEPTAPTPTETGGAPPLYGEIQEAGGVRPYLYGEEPQRGRPVTPEQADISLAETGGGGPFQVGFGRSAAEVRAELEEQTAPRDFSNIQDDIYGRSLEARRSFAGDYEPQPQQFEPEGAAGRRRQAEQPRVREGGREVRQGRRRFETMFFGAGAASPTVPGLFETPQVELGFQGAQPGGLEQLGFAQLTVPGARDRPGGDVTADTAVEARQDIGTETRFDQPVELRQEFETETLQDTRLRGESFRETEQEQEAEFEFETETEQELEAEGNENGYLEWLRRHQFGVEEAAAVTETGILSAEEVAEMSGFEAGWPEPPEMGGRR